MTAAVHELCAGPGSALALRQALAPFSGAQLRAVDVSGPRPRRVEAFGLDAADGRTSLWFVNVTNSTVSLPIENLPTRWFNQHRTSGSHRWETTSSLCPAADGTLTLDLAPYEVCALFPA